MRMQKPGSLFAFLTMSMAQFVLCNGTIRRLDGPLVHPRQQFLDSSVCNDRPPGLQRPLWAGASDALDISWWAASHDRRAIKILLCPPDLGGWLFDPAPVIVI